MEVQRVRSMRPANRLNSVQEYYFSRKLDGFDGRGNYNLGIQEQIIFPRN